MVSKARTMSRYSQRFSDNHTTASQVGLQLRRGGFLYMFFHAKPWDNDGMIVSRILLVDEEIINSVFITI